MNTLDSAYAVEDQLSSQWEFEILPGGNTPSGFAYIKYKVSDVSIPLYKLTVERKITGELMYTGLEDISEVSITLREENNFGTFRFIYEWLSKFYNFEKRCFKVKKNALEDCYDCALHFYNSKPITSHPVYSYTKEPYKQTTEYISSSLFLRNCKPIGIDNLSVTYSGGDPITITFNLQPESIQNYNLNNDSLLAYKGAND